LTAEDNGIEVWPNAGTPNAGAIFGELEDFPFSLLMRAIVGNGTGAGSAAEARPISTRFGDKINGFSAESCAATTGILESCALDGARGVLLFCEEKLEDALAGLFSELVSITTRDIQSAQALSIWQNPNSVK
jgi:hypothetical protein